MSISFSSIKGYHNKINLGDSGYNQQEKFNKNQLYSGGNPTNWNSNHNITKEKGKSIHTRHIQKVGTEIISNMNRNEDSLKDRITENISIYPKGKNVMATGIDYGGTPYKIGDSSKTCKINLGDYVNETQNYALSRKPVQYVNTVTNKSDFTLKPSNISRNVDKHSLKEQYTTANVQLNKMDQFYQNHSNLNVNNMNHKAINDDKLNYSVTYNKGKSNNYNNMFHAQNNQELQVSENYLSVDANTNRFKSNNNYTDHNYLDTNKLVRNGTLLANANTNLHKNFNELEVQRHPVRLENKLNVSEGYNNNRVGIRAPTQNLNFKL
tara:strand:+ start:1980 stop:2948 length:969 start_codon:yes stop_codon:yes gene_type:complete